jgi:hypothetical protein
MGGEEPECGGYQFCSLFSPAFDFRDHGSAIETARAIIMALFTDGEPDPASGREAARLSGSPLAQVPTTRRGFFRGILAA